MNGILHPSIEIIFTLYVKNSAESSDIRLEITWIFTIPKPLV